MKRLYLLCIAIMLLSLAVGCASSTQTFDIISGSENKTLEPIIEQYARQHNVNIVMHYKGSVDMMQLMGTDEIEQYDAVWPANSLWIALGDTNKVIEHERSIMTSPIVFGIKKSLAESLGFVGNDVYIADILQAVEANKLRFMMTSATQSNSGACAYMGFLSAALDNPATIKVEDLNNPTVQHELTKLLAGVNRSSGSSGWLKELFLDGDYPAMVNYEALIIETNQELIARGKEPLYAVYPVDGLAVADSPLGYVNKGDDNKEQIFKDFQAHLLSEDVQKKLTEQGRRTGIAGVQNTTNQTVFNPDWGIDGNKIISGITMPSADVIRRALSMYQSELRKPSFTIYCLDNSGSMEGEGNSQLKAAMATLLDQQQAAKFLIQASPKDVTIVIPFNDALLDFWRAEGNDQVALNQLLDNINQLSPHGGTDIYSPALASIDYIIKNVDDSYNTAIVLLTDGESYDGMSFPQFKQRFKQLNVDIPVFSIMFGAASADQLKEISNLTRARVFDGREDLIKAFKKAKGYN